MKSIVIYFSQTGNTKKVAEAIYSGIRSVGGQCEISTAWDVDTRRLAEFDLIGLGCPVHRLRAPAQFIAFEEALPILGGKHCFLFATHGPAVGMVFRDVGQVLLQKRMLVIGYHSWYGDDWVPGAPKPYFTDGHPDSLDLREAAKFGREIAERSLRISQGETEPVPDILKLREYVFPAQPATEIRLNKEKCRYPICQLCVSHCPVEGCIDLSPQAVTFANQEKCIQCFFCHLICPTGAVEADLELLAEQFKEATPTALRLLESAKARGEFRSLVDKVDIDTPGYKIGPRPRFVIKAAPCTLACPIHIDIPGYLTLAADGKLEDACQVVRGTNPLPAICGRVCYHPCEDACRRHNVDQPIAIASLERFVTDRIDAERLRIPRVDKNGRKVAIIGSGPGGLAAAHDLALLGYEVTIFEALSEAGGMLRVGIPQYRLPRQVLNREIRYIERLGVNMKLNRKIEDQVGLDGLRREYSAVFLATGAQESLRLRIPGEENPGVTPGLEFLKAVNMGKKVGIGRRVAIVGGGNVAIDAARVARRLGASVTVLYHRSRVEMPATTVEADAAKEEGVDFMFLAAPVKIVAPGDGVLRVKCIGMALGSTDASGIRRPVPVEGSEFAIEVDNVVPALGQKPNLDFIKRLGVNRSSEGTLAVDESTLATDIEGVFAGGDLVTGSATMVEAIAAGKRAARSIDNYLKGMPLAVGQTQGRKIEHQLTEQEIMTLRKRVPVESRVPGRSLAARERINNFAEVELGLPLAQGQQEASRCLKCEWKP